jgi:hypothetical protein
VRNIFAPLGLSVIAAVVHEGAQLPVGGGREFKTHQFRSSRPEKALVDLRFGQSLLRSLLRGVEIARVFELK